jgi:hypothetical protein
MIADGYNKYKIPLIPQGQTLRYPHKISIKNNALLGNIRIKTRFSQSEHKNSL